MAKTRNGVDNAIPENTRHKKANKSLDKRSQKLFNGFVGSLRNMPVSSINFFDLDDIAGESKVAHRV